MILRADEIDKIRSSPSPEDEVADLLEMYDPDEVVVELMTNGGWPEEESWSVSSVDIDDDQIIAFGTCYVSECITHGCPDMPSYHDRQGDFKMSIDPEGACAFEMV